MPQLNFEKCWVELLVAFVVGIVVGAIVSAFIAACLYRSKKSQYTAIVHNSQDNQYNTRVNENSSGSRPMSSHYWSIREINGITTSFREDNSRNRGSPRNSPSSLEEFPPPPPELLFDHETLADTSPVYETPSNTFTPTQEYENKTVIDRADQSGYRNIQPHEGRITAATLETKAMPMKYGHRGFRRPRLPYAPGFIKCGYQTGYVNRP